MALALALASALSCQRGDGQPYRVGIVSPSARLDEVIEGFRKGMLDYGYEEGVSIVFIYNGPVGEAGEMQGEIRRLMSEGADMLFTVSLSPSLMAKEITAGRDIPIVFAPVYDPIRSSLVRELGAHECNLTGVQVGGNAAKALYWLMELSPGVRRVLVPYDTRTSTTVLGLSDLKEGADKLGVALVTAEVGNREELAKVLDASGGTVDAIWLLTSYFLVDNIDLFVNASLSRKVPLASGTSQYNKGVTISYGQNMFRTGEMASSLAHKIIRGARPSELPIETTDFFLGINLEMAESIGLDVSDYMLQQADFIAREGR